VYPPYGASGTLTGCVVDAGAVVSWATASWVASVPGGTSLGVRTRTSVDGVTWSGWSAPLTVSGQAIGSPAGRYLQYELQLATADPAVSPVLESISIAYVQ
jgi:hypothetical protein